MPTSLPDLRPGPIDIHAHLLPADCYTIPFADGPVTLEEHNGELHLRGFPIAISSEQISSVPRILADMDAEDIAVRVVSAPPYAFAIDANADAALDYAERVNDGLIAMAAHAPNRLVPLGVLPVQSEQATATELARLADLGVPGVSVPPVVHGVPLGDPPLRHVLRGAEEHGLAVLVHPMQQPRPGFHLHYLQNLIGNPVESATAIASILLGGLTDTLPDLRIAFVHGAGAAPALLGRWDHGWRMRDDVSRDAPTPPSETFTVLYVDSLTHSAAASKLLADVIGEGKLTLGSDYPFDMADPHPCRSAERDGFDLDILRVNALRWLAAN